MRGFKTIKKQPTQPQYEVANVLNKLGSKLEDLGLNSWQLRTLFALKKCRTSALGGHIDACLVYTSPSPRELSTPRMPSFA